MLCNLFIPSAILQLNSASLLGRFPDDYCPCLGHLLVCLLLVSVVLVGIPIGKSVDDVSGAVKEGERSGGLLFVGREKVRSKVFEGVEQLIELLPYPVVCVV